MLSDPTWAEMVVAEPALERLLADIRAVQDDPAKASFCAETHWPKFKSALRLVGFSARNPELRSMEAYETAVSALYAALPACRNCPCLGG
jgi:hypothetical protein